MPSPVSPDAGVPEHQPDPRRRNDQPWTGGQPRQTPNGPSRTGQFEPTGRPQPGPFRTNQPQPGQFPARSGAGRPAPGRPDDGALPSAGPARNDGGGHRRSTSRRDWIWSVVAFLVAAVVIGAVGFYFFGPDSTEEVSAAWAVDGCAGPDPAAEGAEDTEGLAGAYRPLPCDDAEATVTVLDIQDAVSVGQAHCPAGTDLVFQKDGQAGGVTQVVCARNLSDDHPGDPGMGGGQLMRGDCVDEDGREVACSVDGAREVTGLVVNDSGCPDGTADEIELGFDPQRSYATICLGDT